MGNDASKDLEIQENVLALEHIPITFKKAPKPLSKQHIKEKTELFKNNDTDRKVIINIQ